MENINKFVDESLILEPEKVTYWYEGICPQTGVKLRLPRTVLAEKIVISLAEKLNQQEFSSKGKMLGILIVKNNLGQLGVIKAFSGFLQGKREVLGWVVPIPGYSVIALAEKLTLSQLDEIKEEILTLQHLPIRQEYQQLIEEKEIQEQKLKQIHQQQKQARKRKRAEFQENLTEKTLNSELAKLEQESRQNDWERRKFKRQWQEKLNPLLEIIQQSDTKIRELKQKRKQLSRQLQHQMQTAFTLTNFAGNSLSIGEVMGKAFIPTGTGDCCTPKLLHHAATHHLQPMAMAELWWGESTPNGDKVEGNFYPACVERCQPLMGFLLSGLSTISPVAVNQEIEIIYEDDYLLVVNKPSGLLSVAGRGSEKFYSVVTRLQALEKHYKNKISTVHRLDQDTSGILILTKDQSSYVNLSKQFAQRQIQKIYEAVLVGILNKNEGVINLPLYSNPQTRPLQEVNYEKGKTSITYFRRLNITNNETRIEFKPITGRTHQLRLHSAHPHGLDIPIKGDRFYGKVDNNDIRLHLHAREIIFQHPQSDKEIKLITKTPF